MVRKIDQGQQRGWQVADPARSESGAISRQARGSREGTQPAAAAPAATQPPAATPTNTQPQVPTSGAEAPATSVGGLIVQSGITVADGNADDLAAAGESGLVDSFDDWLRQLFERIKPGAAELDALVSDAVGLLATGNPGESKRLRAHLEEQFRAAMQQARQTERPPESKQITRNEQLLLQSYIAEVAKQALGGKHEGRPANPKVSVDAKL